MLNELELDKKKKALCLRDKSCILGYKEQKAKVHSLPLLHIASKHQIKKDIQAPGT